MAKNKAITADLREDAGKGASRRLRRAGWVPGILYGADRPPRSIQLVHEDIILSARQQSFFSSILDLNFNGKIQKVLVRDWQMHPFRQQMLHLDFMRVRDDEEIRVNIPLHFLNAEESPAGKAAEIIISHHLTEVEVLCLPGDLPESIDVDLKELDNGDMVRLSDLQLPENVKLTAFQAEDEDSDEVVVSAQEARVQVEEEATEEAGEDVEAGEEADGEGGEEAGDDGASDDKQD